MPGAPDQQADHGWHAVDACAHASCTDATADYASLGNAPAERLIRDAIRSIAHLCDRCGIDPLDQLHAAVAEYRAESVGDSRLVPLTLFAEHDSSRIRWQLVPRPDLPRQRHRDTVLRMLIAAGCDGVTTTELRDRGVKNPANVVLNLIRQGHPIARCNEHHPNQHGGHTRYILEPRQVR